MKRLAIVLVACPFLTTCLRGDTPVDQAAVTFARQLQADDGGFRPAPDEQAKSSLRATLAAVRALKYFGGSPRDADAAARFVASCYDRASGGFADTPGGKPDVTLTAVGLMVVVDLKLPAEKYQKAVDYLADNAKTFDEIRITAAALEAVRIRPRQADAWLAQVKQMRNADGSYGKGDGTARETGGAVVVVLRFGGSVEQRETVVDTLKKGQRGDGGFGKTGTPASDLETTYRVVRAFVMLKERPADVGRCRAFVRSCRNADGGYGVAPGQPSTASATYYAAIVQYWLAAK